MTFECTEEEFSELLQLAFLGNYVINSSRAPKEELSSYTALTEKLYRAEYARRTGLKAEDAEENEVADVSDRVSDSVQEYLEAFEDDIKKS